MEFGEPPSVEKNSASFYKYLDNFFNLSAFDKPLEPKRTVSGASKVETVNAMEPIATIAVPEPWQKEVLEPRFGEVAKSVSFIAPESGGAALSLYDRGYPLTALDADSFNQVLKQAPHKLEEDDVCALSNTVLGNIGDQSAFNLTQARTRALNGKTVLEVEGNWIEGGKKFIGVFIPKDDAAKGIQEVFFEAQEPHFSRLKPEALKSIESLRWQKK